MSDHISVSWHHAHLAWHPDRGPQQPGCAQGVLKFQPLKAVLGICPILVSILITKKLIARFYEDNVRNKDVNCDIL